MHSPQQTSSAAQACGSSAPKPMGSSKAKLALEKDQDKAQSTELLESPPNKKKRVDHEVRPKSPYCFV